MEEYRQYLAQKILTEDQPVTYRLLSRALNVHVNTAKEYVLALLLRYWNREIFTTQHDRMLYDFHKWQNDKKPGALFATYLVSGVKGSPESQDDDIEMTDSQSHDDGLAPFSELVPTNTISLVNESQLQDTLAQYSKVTSIHVYSLAVHPLKDLQLLADTGKQAHELAAQNPDSNEDLGTITNLNVRRRERRKGAPIAAAAVKSEAMPVVKLGAKSSTQATAKEEPKESSQTTKKFASSASTSAKKPAPASTLKRQGSSGIGQMFAKAAANPKKQKKAGDSTPASGTEDNQSAGAMSDDGEDDTETKPVVKEEDSKARQKRQDRQAELRRMMEESDNEELEKEESADEPMEDDEPPPPEPEPEPEVKPEEPAEVVSSATGGRRRGRRRVTKKKQIMDDKGYLVTVQEQGWESFSEDETPTPAPAPLKAASQPVKAEEKGKPKKAAGKAGQGNIMSFFSKK
ncbi:hypothetical protein GGR57DRAFT_180483 [Xylariaceae sp. FL1272]|nr:hypothetical protein GGR57DRAFT_180483 [Xylariaceae sp. FL1272]